MLVFLSSGGGSLKKKMGCGNSIIRAKYLSNKNIFSVTHKANDSPIWSDLLKVKDLYLQGRSIRIGNGRKTRFWSDPWLYEKSLACIVPTLFILCDQKEVSG
jgi:hypothetical protein